MKLIDIYYKLAQTPNLIQEKGMIVNAVRQKLAGMQIGNDDYSGMVDWVDAKEDRLGYWLVKIRVSKRLGHLVGQIDTAFRNMFNIDIHTSQMVVIDVGV